MRSIDPSKVSAAESHRYLLAGVAPRPIAFVASLDADGRPNLSPFSFFNAFGANPPVIAFSPAHRGTDASVKHTYENIIATGEFTVSAVSHSMVEQMNLASAEYPAGVDEFVKAGFTKLPSSLIAPPGVRESPFVMECRLLQHVDFGDKPSAANILIGEVVMFHIKESVMVGNYPDYRRLDLVARMGGPYYCRANGDAVFALDKPSVLGIGFDALPDSIRLSRVLTGNDLGKLAGVATLPTAEEVTEFWSRVRSVPFEHEPDDLELELRGGDAERAARIVARMLENEGDQERLIDLCHRLAALYLRHGEVQGAWCAALAAANDIEFERAAAPAQQG